MAIYVRAWLLIATTVYQIIASQIEDRKSPPGQMVDIGGYRLHLYTMGEGSPTIVIDHSLGGVEGYLLIENIAKLARVCIYDRAGYGWSDRSPHPRTSEQIVTELDALLTQAGIEPPYILVGNSFGSYNVRLYAHRFPEKVVGIVLTDGLHETSMLKMPMRLQALKMFFISGFAMSVLGSSLGFIRLLKTIGIFELLKPGLRQFPPERLDAVKRSFCRPKHWLTMAGELFNIDRSSQQVKSAEGFGNLPIISIKAKTFFHPSLGTIAFPIGAANRLRDEMHPELMRLSSNQIQISADRSSHFVWIDEPDIIVKAIEMMLEKLTAL
jgi:pimeloyl-ACP methyl ester carboxylesterase